jgi:phosphopantetheine adenylyltransferase
MLQGRELIDAKRKLEEALKRAEELLTGLTGDNMAQRLNERSSVMLRVESLKRRIDGTTDAITKAMDYKVTPVCRINI